ncbi:NAD-dependent protein deacetylase sirtuin-2 [Lepeophtheirus salmonis]|uniref:Deacetylase sirtuin-type domain-containing protein n=1 Tax=Lepeophtheirus salmonis TaxID=72036 RepID=A0A0K2UXZ9_LEPSM|nr:NAD-dependent protein deacetylase sirtuin-2-like [Lepeophtheirus salmonis]XP_040569753.1 NAD-dependent protein deacetylase sirtuin-2-like [Lepeophtheirus salmonis]XP_040569754.1 NAD-dependent protein deacetylase sirtuin-2-like [Lepeophtheirus salmonis]
MGQGSSSSIQGFSVESLVSQIQNGRYKNIVILCGAGISTNAGIPDFRSPSFGLYFKLRKFDLPYPEAVFEGKYFNKDPNPFYGLIREIYPSQLIPTDTHKFFTLLHQKGLLRRVITQNIDALEYLGGLPEDLVVEAHGSFRRSYCTKCSETYELPWLKDAIFHPEKNNGVPKCEACGGVVRPDVVLFGETMPSRFCNLAHNDLKNADLLLVFGTSLAVAPYNGLITLTKSQIPRVYVSKTKPGQSTSTLGSFLGLNSSIKFDKPNDLVLIEDCDQVVRNLCSKLNWTQELNKL